MLGMLAKNRLDLVAGLCDGILTALILAGGTLLQPQSSMSLGLSLRVAAAAAVAGAFIFFVAQTPIRTAWLLGQLKDARAVQPLIDLVNKTDDVYIARAAVHALGEIDSPEARQFLPTLANHPAKMVRDEVQQILSGRNHHRPYPEEREEQP